MRGSEQPASNPAAGPWSARLKAELLRDKKKTGLLLGLVLVAGIVGGKALLGGKTPAAAQARNSPVTAGTAGGGTVQPSLDRAAADQRRAQYLANLDRRIGRDIFRMSSDYFPLEGQVPAPAPAVAEPDFLDHLTQLAQGDGSDSKKEALIRAQAQSLALQSTMLGSSPSALINGRVLHVGDVISGFALTQIDTQTVTLTREGVTVTLQMMK